MPEAGEYVVEIEYAIHRRHAGLPVDILIDQKKQLSFTTQDTGGDSAYKRVAIGTVRLEKGRQDLAFAPVKSDQSKLFVMQLLRGVYLTRR